MLRLICMFLGCDMPIQLVCKIDYKINYKIIPSCMDYITQTTKYVTFYA